MSHGIKLIICAAALASVIGLSPTAHAEQKSTEKNKSESDEKIITVKAGDTLSSIAEQYDRSYIELYNANDAISNPNAIDIGDKVRIPKKDEKLNDRFSTYQAQVAAAAASAPVAQAQSTTTQTYTSAPINSSSYYVGNGMWCTDYVHSKRPDVAIYGNAGYNWISSAQAAGKSTGNTAREGAVAVQNGHVAYVESVNADGSYVVSEMGWNYQAGNYNKRTVQPGTFGGFIY